ncbi:replication restart helicase PriA [Novipirellula artificiosorum]|uniref:Replication restart protein PriA n=1 Tax=Novipirellula artificiosorum TaxID=2528016 RepID=A0A5C6E0D5_9BACT|nr:primosomal protein N' [Novipirellula artificiosorum]TWU42320.1 Primosomal protein N' [Novipirellula artificiosorum]
MLTTTCLNLSLPILGNRTMANLDPPQNPLPNDDLNRHDDPLSIPEPRKSQQAELFETEPPPWELTVQDDVATAKIVFSEAPFGPYDYRIPDEDRDRVKPGMRVRVPLGRRRQPMTGWCIETHLGQVQRSGKLRDIVEILDEEPLCDAHLVRLVSWISHYYQTPMGQVFDTLIPSSVRANAGTRERTYLTPCTGKSDEKAIDSLPKKQQVALRFLIAAGRPMTASELMVHAECTRGPISALQSKGFLEVAVRREMTTGMPMRWAQGDGEEQQTHVLSSEQTTALQRIDAAIDSGKGKTLLLHGVTGSGKTEVYIKAIEHVVRFGRGAIVMVPEISLTPQTRGRFERRFDSVAVLHSQMTPAERHFQWQRIRRGEVQVVVGPRSAVFAPLPRLGLIVIDEEHDASFKQDTQPRYHARKVAHARAMSLGVPLILGSATPSMESWHATATGHAELITMNDRINQRPMPNVELVDLRVRDDRTRGAISRQLHQAVQETLTENGQVILLLNRRGFATTIQCPSCGHVVACPDCDMPLTHHRDGGKAVCHYCDYTIATPPWCPACRYDGIRYGGLGTQKLEVEVKARFPNAKVARMDSDTMRRPGSHQRVLSSFRSGELNILLGTQMIAKGLDFPNVLLVGVINADSALHFPDFRAAERTFQLVTQVAGRTGRGDRGGRVVVQTFSPEHPAIQAASRHDYLQFANDEMVNRRKFNYPPLGSVARIIIRGIVEEVTEAVAEQLLSRLEAARLALGVEVRLLGPAPPPISKLRGKYRFHILLQATEAAILGNTIRRATDSFTIPDKDDVQYVVDIDPMDML